MAENERRLPVVDLGRLLSPEAFSKLRAARQRREQAERAVVAPFEESKQADSGNGPEETCREQEKGVSEHGKDVTDVMALAAAKESLFNKEPINMHINEHATRISDLDDKVMTEKRRSLSLGPLKKRKRPKTVAGLLTLGARDDIRVGLEFAVARLVESMACSHVPCSLVSAYHSIPLSCYRRTYCSRYVHTLMFASCSYYPFRLSMLTLTIYHYTWYPCFLYSTPAQNETIFTVSPPSLEEIANYPDYSHQAVWNGTKVCIMCGERRPYKTRISTVASIRPSDKCICTSCQVQVWVVPHASIHYKWCAKCKTFKRVVNETTEQTKLTCKECRQKDVASRRRKRLKMDKESS